MIRTFEPCHLRKISPQAAQVGVRKNIDTPGYGQWLVDGGPAYTFMDGDEVMACAGFVEQTEQRVFAWAILSEHAGRVMTRLHRATSRGLTMHGFRRVETFVVEGFDAGVRWIELLGFQREGLMRSYLEDGQNAWLYARTKK